MSPTFAELLHRFESARTDGERDQVRDALTAKVHAELARMVERRGVSPSELDLGRKSVAVAKRILAGEVGRETVERYLHTCARHVVADHGRQAAREGPTLEVNGDLVVDPSPSPPNLLDLARRLEQVKKALSGPPMPERYRTAIREVIIEGRDPADLAAREGVDPETVTRWVSRGRAWLRKHLAGLDVDGGRS